MLIPETTEEEKLERWGYACRGECSVTFTEDCSSVDRLIGDTVILIVAQVLGWYVWYVGITSLVSMLW